LIKLENLAKSFPGVEVLKEISLEVGDGEFFAIVGPSGCGKTTLLRVMAGLEEKSSGKVSVSPNMAMVFQSGALLPWLNALRNVSFGLRMRGEKDAERIAREKLAEVGLADFEERFPRELSGGQRQRVGIARALAVSPSALLLDEPFSALDALTTRKLHQDLLKIWHAGGMSIVLVSHSIEEAVELADRVAVMSSGKIIETVEIALPRPRVRGNEMFRLVERIEGLLVS
jgi:NitT/TauT family transport system ATP-binding protein